MGEFKTERISIRSLYGKNKTGRIQSCIQYSVSICVIDNSRNKDIFPCLHKIDDIFYLQNSDAIAKIDMFK